MAEGFLVRCRLKQKFSVHNFVQMSRDSTRTAMEKVDSSVLSSVSSEWRCGSSVIGMVLERGYRWDAGLRC